MLIIPIGTNRDFERFPYVTVGIIGANVVVFGLELAGLDRELLALVPADFHIWALFTSMFAHADIFHIAGNMLFLWIFGGHAELAMGIPKYLLLYFSAGIGADLLHMGIAHVASPEDLELPLLGASGAVMGVVALFALRYRKVMVEFWYLWLFGVPRAGTFEITALNTALIYFAMNLIFGLLDLDHGGGGVAYWAHIGGLLVGAIWAFAGGAWAEGTREEQREEIASLFKTGAWRTALSKGEKYLASGDDPEVRAELARHYVASGAPQRGYWHWNKALGEWLSSGDEEAAASHFESLRASSGYAPQELDPGVLLRMAKALDNVGRFALGVATCRDILQHHSQAREAPAAALEAGLIAKTHVGDMRLARQYFEYVCRQWPTAPEASRAQRELLDLR